MAVATVAVSPRDFRRFPRWPQIGRYVMLLLPRPSTAAPKREGEPEMDRRRRRKAEHPDEWEWLVPLFDWPEQERYEEIRPLVTPSESFSCFLRSLNGTSSAWFTTCCLPIHLSSGTLSSRRRSVWYGWPRGPA